MKSRSGKLAFFLPNLNGAGAERVLLNLANGIVRRGYAVDVVAASAQGAFLPQVAPEINIVDLGSPRVLSSVRPLVNYLRKEPPQVLIAAIHANFAALWAQRMAHAPTRVAVTQHAHITAFAQNARNWKERIEPQLVRIFFPRADYRIAVSNGVAESLSVASGIPLNTIDVIYNPVITPDLEVKAQATLDHPWFAPGQPPVILGVGRLMAQKRFSDLIEAFALVRAQTPVRLLILGEGVERPMLEQKIAQLGLEADISLPGFVDNPYAYMAHADLFAMSSIFEGLPTVLVEALYCGTPIVSTDCPSGPNEILAGGRYGHLTPPRDPHALASAILRGLNGDIPQPTPASWQAYEMDHVIDQYLALLMTSEERSRQPIMRITHDQYG